MTYADRAWGRRYLSSLSLSHLSICHLLFNLYSTLPWANTWANTKMLPLLRLREVPQAYYRKMISSNQVQVNSCWFIISPLYGLLTSVSCIQMGHPCTCMVLKSYPLLWLRYHIFFWYEWGADRFSSEHKRSLRGIVCSKIWWELNAPSPLYCCSP